MSAANNKLVQQRLCQETGKVILLKDLANITNRSKVQQSRNDLSKTVDMLIKKYGRLLSNIRMSAYVQFYM